MKYKIIIVFLINMLMIGSIFGSAVTVNIRSNYSKINKNDLNVEMSDFKIKTMKYDWGYGRNFKEKNTDFTIANVETLSIEYNENINILKDGKAELDVSIEVPQSKLAENYRDMLGATTNLKVGETLSIPESITLEKEDKTILAVGKEGFHNSVFQEQWYSLGLITEIENSKMTPLGYNNECSIDIEGNANLQVKELTDDKWTVNIGLSSEQDMINKTRFISSVIGYTKLMLSSLDGEQVFKRSWVTRIGLPYDATLLNSEEIEGLNWKLDFGSGTFMQATLAIENSVISIYETLLITENEEVNPIPAGRYKSFEIEYFLPNSPSAYENENLYPPISSLTWEDDIFNWETSYDETWSDPGNHVTVDFHVGFSADVTVHLDLEQAWVKPEFHTEGSFDIVFSESYTYEPDPYQIFYKDWWIDIQLGPVPVVIHVEAAVELRFLFEAEANLEVHTSFDADAWFKAGAKYSLWDGFNTIWQSGFEKNINEPTVTGSARLMIRPSICFPIKAKVYGLFGPVVTPELYLEGFLKYTGELFWYFKIGFCVNVGVCVGIPYIWDESWEWNIADWTIYEVGSTTPSKDTLPPLTTLVMYSPPMYNIGGDDWITGRYLYFYFQAIDQGNVPSGVDYTKFKVGSNNWMNYNYPEIWRAEITEDPGYYSYPVNWYSTDNLGQQETTHTYTVNAELYPPTSNIIVGDPHDGDNVIANVTPIKLQAQDDLTGWKIWFRVWHEDDGWSEWYNGDENTPVSFKFTELAVGNCKVEWCAVDGVWNFEEIQSQSFYVTIQNSPPIMPDLVDGPHSGRIGINYEFTVHAWDPDRAEELQFRIDWANSGWSNWQDFDNEYNDDGKTKASKRISHTWSSPFNGNIKVQSRDDQGALSDIFNDYKITIADNARPILTDGQVSPNSGTTSTSFTYKVIYSDDEGDAPISCLVYIDDFAYNMNLISGDYKNGAIYTYETPLTRGDHNYYFKFIGSNGRTVEFPTSGSISGPYVEPDNNLPPNKPDTPSGPSIVVYGDNANFKTKTSDPEKDELCYQFIFKGWKGLSIRGKYYRFPIYRYSKYCGPYASGKEITVNLNAPEDYERVIDDKWEVYVVAKDEWGAISETSDFTTFITTHRPDAPSIKGPSEGITGESYKFSATTNEPDGENIYYFFDWEDGTDSGWLGPFDSGETVNVTHIWNKQNNYYVKVRAKDEHGITSDWGTLKINIPRNRKIIISNLLQMILKKIIELFTDIIRIINM